MSALLEITDLRVDFDTRAGTVQALRGVSLSLERGETLGIVGESGSGKSVTAQAVMGLIDVPGGSRAAISAGTGRRWCRTACRSVRQASGERRSRWFSKAR